MSATQKQVDLATVIIMNPVPSQLAGNDLPRDRCGDGICYAFGGSANLEFCGNWLGLSDYCCSAVGAGFGANFGSRKFPCEDITGITDLSFDQFGSAPISANLECPENTNGVNYDPVAKQFACCERDKTGVLRWESFDKTNGSIELQGIRCFDPKIIKLSNIGTTGPEPTSSPVVTSSSSSDRISSSATIDESLESTIATQSSVSRDQTTSTTGAQTTSTGSLPELSSFNSEDLGSSTESPSPSSQSPTTSTPTPNSAPNGISKITSLVFGAGLLAMIIGAQL
ncbi:uncharacterized protein DFL_008908 [Arthrobotrys flagrans]|uniref:Uncharacterized protein n=1 Tax=Arthrobotrys flagrans TaxID=97331 RepID=A0A436ZQ47_ARTFL|nr:hypothetical protein DFL_008908 [Arthrobotrys flagrans]